MKDIKDLESVSNERFYLDAYSTISFEKELLKRNIQFLKDDSYLFSPSIIYSFLECDIEAVTQIFNKFRIDENKQQDLIKQKKKEKKKAQRKTLAYRQKQISLWILILIGIIIVSILIS